ncbi:MAG: GAF sensor protein [Nitrospinae bacterium CG11_big_fil_rev_8_21_14_0_20_56_8]|nr:MAG: GAF sensor protein [Nitrospinae bacterium CG11_big_fil_rev_8_21_14_0_20_56_8]
MSPELEKLTQTIQKFGKENLSDILHYTATGLQALFGCKMSRIYLEDLYEGMLICHYVTGQNQAEKEKITQFVASPDSIMTLAFFRNEVILSWKLGEKSRPKGDPFAEMTGIRSSAIFPITHQLRPIGALSLDWDRDGECLSEEKMHLITGFLLANAAVIDRAKKFHQKISFSRHLDLARKKEAAFRLVRSAVKLIDRLTLASVLVPLSTQNLITKSQKPSDLAEVMAVFSKNKEDALIYSNKDRISILHNENLINRIVRYDEHIGLVAKDPDIGSVYIEDIGEEEFTRKDVVSQINLVSFYQIPKFNRQTGHFICAVNYYTNQPYRFSKFEKHLLEDHAAMIEKLILEESPEHIEIQVLSEIEGLLSEKDDSLQDFLHRILDKVSELIGAACGTISLTQTIDGKPWLVVETPEGKLVGAKSRGWMKSTIPPLPIGGDDMPVHSKSLNGYCAHTARPILVNDVYDPELTQGFYKNLLPSVQAEMAVPLIYGHSVLGVITQDSFRKNYFTDEHKKILQIISTLIASKVHNLIQLDDLKHQVSHIRRDIEYRDPKVSSYHLGNVIGKSQRIHSLVRRVDTVVESICNRMLEWERGKQDENTMGLPCLLLYGQTGTGKEFFFNNIYSRITEVFQKAKGAHFKAPLRKTNIAAYSGDLTYSELFGHAKGAFTGAEFHREGILEEANGGVVFLDEIGDADPKTQVQLLRFLDTGVFLRLGENRPRYSRIFLIAATNKNLREEIEKGKFREDLFHRLNALSFNIPSLNERREDIEDLAIHFLGILEQAYKRDFKDSAPLQMEKEAIEYLKNYHYRGNVRELKNILLRAVMFRKDHIIRLEDVAASSQTDSHEREIHSPLDAGIGRDAILDRLESGSGDFWSEIHLPFKQKRMTRDTVRNLIDAARFRYQANLPGLAIKLRAVSGEYPERPEERRKFISFKNFLYKTVKITAIH